MTQLFDDIILNKTFLELPFEKGLAIFVLCKSVNERCFEILKPKHHVEVIDKTLQTRMCFCT